MQFQLLLILEYPKHYASILEQSRLYQTTQVSIHLLVDYNLTIKSITNNGE